MRLSLSDRIRGKVALKTLGGRMPLALDRGVLSITFDDFPKSAWTDGGPVLADHGALGTYYVSGGFRGGVSEGLRQFDDADLEGLVEAGHELGCHTFDHVSALKTSPREFAASLDRNAAFVAERFAGYRMESFAFPFGDVSWGADNAIAARGYSSARGIIPQANTSPAKPMLLAAVGLEHRKREEYDFEALIAEAARNRSWLILYTHDVSDSPGPYGCTPKALDRVLTQASAAGLRIAPVRQVMREQAP
jgi:peptidoglycan/xylan/chitin deacetylase (PgdA/CDA1 family)